MTTLTGLPPAMDRKQLRAWIGETLDMADERTCLEDDERSALEDFFDSLVEIIFTSRANPKTIPTPLALAMVRQGMTTARADITRKEPLNG